MENVKRNGTRITTRKRKRILLKALEENKGLVTFACKSCNISKQSYYKYFHADPEFRKLVEQIQENVLDFAEHCLYRNMNQGSDSSTIFYLKCRGRSRGYIEKQDIQNTIINDPLAGIDRSKLSDEQLDKLEIAEITLQELRDAAAQNN